MTGNALRWMASASILLAFASIRPAQAQTKDFNVPAQSATTGIPEFARQAGIQILVSESLVRGKRISAVTGSHTIDEALEILLKGTGLTAMSKDGATYTVAAAQGPSTTRNPPAAFATSAKNLPVGDPSPAPPDNDKGVVRLEEVIVTAQKREQRLIDVPISIVALSADELVKRRITTIDDLSFAVPGLAIASTSFQRRIEIRGISNAVGGSLPLIGMYLDEADVTTATASQLDVDTYDLERVEVLRGPQGTLYGEGSAGGTIHFITKNPQLDRFIFDSDIAASFTQDGSPSQRIQAVVNVPMIQHELGLRIAGTFDHQGGWIDQPAAGRKDWNGQNRTDVRIKGLWQPIAQFNVNAMAVIHRNETAPNIGEDANGNYTQAFNLTTTPTVQDDFGVYNLALSYDFSSFRLLSTTSFVRQNQVTRNLGWYFQAAAPPAPHDDILDNPEVVKSSVLTDELRLSSMGSGPWQWTLGGYFRRARFEQQFLGDYFGLPVPLGSPLPGPFQFGSNVLSKSVAAFGDTSYKFGDRFTLGAGVRYFHDDQDFANLFGTGAQAGTFHSVDPRAYAQFKASDQVNVYASASKGFRSGGFNSLNQPSYGPESVWTYEFGTKMSMLDGRLSADAAVFYSRYSDYQIQGILPPPAQPVGITSNGGSARIKGVEWDLAWHPVEQWTLSFNGNYLTTRFYKINAIARPDGTPSAAFIVGDQLDFIPKYTINLSTQHDFVLRETSGFVRLDYNH
jgi:iron complex outermembrane receptor protein